MELECNDKDNTMKVDPDPPDTQVAFQHNSRKMLSTISSQMMATYQDLQDQLIRNDLKLTTELHRVVQSNDAFKQEICREWQSIQNTTIPSTSSTIPNTTNVSPPSTAAAVSPQVISSLSTTTTIPNSSNNDFQSQMLLLLNETFSKLSTVIMDMKSESKAEWPKFSGDTKKLRSWYLAIMAQLLLSPWQSLYDPVKNDIISSTTNSQLNGKLYAKLLVSLDGQALQNMVFWKHLCTNGLLLLQELHQMYRLKNVPEVIAAKTGEFQSQMKCSTSEAVDVYYNHFH
jgi:hypothetical protein